MAFPDERIIRNLKLEYNSKKLAHPYTFYPFKITFKSGGYEAFNRDSDFTKIKVIKFIENNEEKIYIDMRMIGSTMYSNGNNIDKIYDQKTGDVYYDAKLNSFSDLFNTLKREE